MQIGQTVPLVTLTRGVHCGRTLSVAVDVETSGRRRRLADPVLGDTLDRRVVVACRLHRLNAQQRPAQRRRHHLPTQHKPQILHDSIDLPAG